jgi:hypothetical protein
VPGSPDDPQLDAISISTFSPFLYSGFCDQTFPEVAAAIAYARSRGIAVLVASGNSGASGSRSARLCGERADYRRRQQQ